jgi:pyocin large subunit-like protein
MNIFPKICCGLLLIFLVGISACRTQVVTPSDLQQPATTVGGNNSQQAKNNPVNTKIGFRTKRKFDDHFVKHGREFGSITQDEYLRIAQTLRDAPVGGDILELSRGDGTVSRFDRSSGTFTAFDKDLTLRTCFKPNDGERYFKRQINKEH